MRIKVSLKGHHSNLLTLDIYYLFFNFRYLKRQSEVSTWQFIKQVRF